MILESIVTTLGENGQVNLAPMGPVVTNPDAMRSTESKDPEFVLRPFEGSRTFENLKRTLRATIHVTDDAALFAAAAIGRLDHAASLVRSPDSQRSEKGRTGSEPFSNGQWAILNRCHRWFAVEVISVIETPPRYEMRCRVIDSAIELPFFGFNRAKHAVIEAAILATRTHLISPMEIQSQLDLLRPMVDKTAGTAEREAFDMLTTEIIKRADQNASTGTK